MPTVAIKRAFEFYGTDDDGKLFLFPRSVRNADFARAFKLRTKNISFSDRYNGFPFSVKIGSTIVGVFSEGDSHANSDKQIMYRTDDFGLTYQTRTFYDKATNTFDASLMSGLLLDGESALFKVWTITSNGGALTVDTQSTVVYGGLTYAMWGAARVLPSGVFVRTGYAANNGSVQSAVFESSDKRSWTFRSLVFAETGKLYSESDIVNTSGSNWLAVCREDGGAGNPLYASTSTDNCATWSAPVLFTGTSGTAPVAFSGRQPNLTKLSDNSIILAVGDRTGTSGISSAGSDVDASDKTGICVWRNTNAGASNAWSFATMIAGMYSTDGGQPYVSETTAGRVCMQFYARRALDETPGIGSVIFDVANL